MALGLSPIACGEDEAPEGSGAAAGSSGQAGSSGRGGSGGTAGSGGAGARDAGADAALQSVTVTFKAKVGQADFACGRSYSNQGSSAIRAQPKDLRFYVQDVKLSTSSGTEVPVVFD